MKRFISIVLSVVMLSTMSGLIKSDIIKTAKAATLVDTASEQDSTSQVRDIELSLENSTSAYDNTGLEGTFSWNGGYEYQGHATYDGVTSKHKYLMITYTGDISSLRLSNDDASQIIWFTENEMGNFVDVIGETLPEIGEETTVVIDLLLSGIDPMFFSDFHIHSGDDTTGSVTISYARLIAEVIGNPLDSTPIEGVEGCDLELVGLAWENENGISNLSNGDIVTFTAAIKNNSNVDIPEGATIRLKVSIDGTTDLLNYPFNKGLKAGETAKISLLSKWTATLGGHTVVATVDPSNNYVDEKSEENNSVTKLFNVIYKANTSYTPVTGGCDLVVTDIKFDKETINSGDKVKFIAVVANAGDVDIPAGTKIGVYFKTSGATWPALTETWSDTYIDGLKAGEIIELVANGGYRDDETWLATTGEQKITAHVDNEWLIDEVDDGNNWTEKTITIPFTTSYIENPDKPDDLDNLEQIVEYSVKIDGTEVATLGEGEVYTFPNTAKVGYYGDGKLYKKGSTYIVTKDIEFYSVGITAGSGASIKWSKPSGMRFSANLTCSDTDFYNTSVIKTGMLIAPYDFYSEDGNLDFTSEYIFLNVENSGWTGVNGSYGGGLASIAPDNFNRLYIARAYVTVEYADGSQSTVYSNMSGVRSVGGVAQTMKDTASVYNNLSTAQKALIETYISAGN